jgi:hypothetical protein
LDDPSLLKIIYLYIKIDILGSSCSSSAKKCGKPRKSLMPQGKFLHRHCVYKTKLIHRENTPNFAPCLSTENLFTIHKHCG